MSVILLCVQDGAVPDHYVIYGDNYTTIRDVLAEVVIGRDIADLTDCIKVLLA